MNLFAEPLFAPLLPGRFLQRPNRFVAECDLDGRPVAAHLPNPGRLQELLLPGRRVSLVAAPEGSDRALPYTVAAVERDGATVLLHTTKANTAVRHLLEQHAVPGLEDAVIVKAEATVGASRFDFLLEHNGRPLYLEVKSCTLFGKRLAMFPDAVTARGKRHLEELATLSRRGIASRVLFLVSGPATHFLPDYHTDPDFAATALAVRHNVPLQAVGVTWNPDLTLSRAVRDLPIPWPLLEREAQDRGCYLLLLRLDRRRVLDVGSLGRTVFPAGWYVYAGSAKRALDARLARHLRRRKTFFWHIDTLRDVADAVTALPLRTGDDLEHALAAALAPIAADAVPRFGSSDCACPSHLFHFDGDPLRLPAFLDLLQYFRMDRLTLPDA